MNNNLLATFGGVMSTIGYVLLAILILLVMITVHEFGHYIAGKIFKFKINEFAIGFGPKIFSKTKKNGEKFSLRALPLGGFCAFHGEDEQETDQDSFNSHAPWKRIIVLISGALMNYLFALILIIITFSVYGDVALMTYNVEQPPSAIYTQENSFISRDIILKAQGKNVYLTTDLMKAVSGKKAGDSVSFTIYRDGKVQEINVLLRADTNFNNVEQIDVLYNALGISYEMDAQTGQITKSGLYTTGVRYGFFQTIGRSVEYSVKIAGTIFTVLGQLITGSLGLSAMGGTVTTISVTATAIKVGGIRNLLNIASFIGVNLAVFNLLPIPALDGSRVVFTLFEWIFKKPINRKAEGVIHTIGLILLLIFAVVVDLQRCF